ncbi:MAG TPA: hypothetical protein VNF26_05820 [Candidatus Baltobacterales bacterium]|nr:hypothetical protein [Candidatus Baltobacterales bacterium]
MSVGGLRIKHARFIVVVAALAACSAILWLARSYTFYFDEWSFILTAPDWTWVTYLDPHNEHPVMALRAIYAVLLSTVGIRTYLPYMLALLVSHAACALLLFELIRRRAGDAIALACAALLLVLGAGWEDLLWAFQLAFVGSVACGLGLLLAIEGTPGRGRLAIAAILATASMTFSAIGLFFAMVAGARLILARTPRRDLLWFAPVVLAFGAWYLAFGRHGTPTVPPPSAANVLVLPAYIAWGLAGGVAGLIGVTGQASFVVLLPALAAVAFSWWRERPDPLAAASAVGLVAFYGLTGLTRAQLGVEQSASGRYVYVGAVLWLILLASLAPRLPWRGTWRPALIACLFLACFNSSVLLVDYAAAKTQVMAREVADMQALAALRTDPCLNPSGAVDGFVMPYVTSPALYYRAIDLYGNPVAGMPVTDQADFARAKLNLVSSGCR